MMNNILITVFLSAYLLCCTTADAQEKRALLVAIGDYPANSGWKRLSSKNDIVYLRKALQVQGFDSNAITILENEKATLEGIRSALEQLVKQSKPGDVVMFHFSGHGQQIYDDNGDEADGFDEAIIPYDARSKYDPIRYDGQMHMRDDEIGRYLDRISEAVGASGSVLVSIDACHSGTATRSQSLAITRGEPTPFIIPGKPKVAYHPGQGSVAGAAYFAPGTSQKSNIIFFSASGPNQVNFEIQDAEQNGVGSLSYALAQSLLTMPANASYQDLFYNVKSIIQADVPTQLPMMEGNGLQKIFSGNYSTPQSSIYIDRWLNDSSFIVPLGTLQQMAPGAVLSIMYPATGKQAGTAIISSATAVESVAVTNLHIDKKNAWGIKIISMPAPPYQLLLMLDDKASWPKNTKQQLQSWLKEMPFVQQQAPATCWISYSADSGIVIIDKEGVLPYYDVSTKNALNSDSKIKLITALQTLAKSNYMRRLPDGGPLAETVTWQLTPSKLDYDPARDLIFEKGQHFDLKLTNRGTKTIYFALVNILPDHSISVLLPDETSPVQDFAIPPGESFSIPDNMVEESAIAGREFLRVMVAETPFDIRPVFNKESKVKRSTAPNGWEAAMQAIMQNEGTKISGRRSIPVNEITLLTQSFLVR